MLITSAFSVDIIVFLINFGRQQFAPAHLEARLRPTLLIGPFCLRSMVLSPSAGLNKQFWRTKIPMAQRAPVSAGNSEMPLI